VLIANTANIITNIINTFPSFKIKLWFGYQLRWNNELMLEPSLKDGYCCKCHHSTVLRATCLSIKHFNVLHITSHASTDIVIIRYLKLPFDAN
jgi:hypothetical protein